MTGGDDRARAPSRKLQVVEASSGKEGLEVLLRRVDALDEDGVLEVVFEDETVAAELQGLAPPARGYWLGRAGDRVWRLGRRPLPPFVDLTELEAPGPLEETLRAATTLGPGEIWTARYPHYPVHLPPRLAARSVDFEIVTRPDGSGILWMKKR